jgi:hypothetical protein
VPTEVIGNYQPPPRAFGDEIAQTDDGAFNNKVVLTDDGAFGNEVARMISRAFNNKVALTDDVASSLRRLMSPLSQNKRAVYFGYPEGIGATCTSASPHSKQTKSWFAPGAPI